MGEETKKRAGTPLDPFWLFAAAREGWKWLALALVVGTLVGGVGALVWPSRWETDLTLVRQTDEPEAADERQRALAEARVAVGDQAFLLELRERLGIDTPLDQLALRVGAETDTESGVLRLWARSSSAQGAEALARVGSEIFLDRARVARAAQLRALVEGRQTELESAQRAAHEARARYDAFRAEHGLSELSSEQESSIENVAQWATDADVQAVAVASFDARIAALREEIASQPRTALVTADSQDSVREALAAARVELTTLAGQLTEEHPRVIAARAQVESLEARLAAGGTGSSAGAVMGPNPVRVALEASLAEAQASRAEAAQREISLRALVQEARARVSGLAEIEGEVAELVSGLRIADAQVDELRADVVRAQSRLLHPEPGFAVLSPATIPETPVASRTPLLLLVLFPLGLFGLTWLGLALRGGGGSIPKARSAGEVAWWGNAPVIGTTTWPRDPGALDLLVGELEDYGVYAAGRTLVVPGTAEEVDLACEFAARLAAAPWLAAGVLDVEEQAVSSAPPAMLPAHVDSPSSPTPSSPSSPVFVERPTLPMPLSVVDGIEAAHAADAEVSRPSLTRVRRATVRVMRDSLPDEVRQEMERLDQEANARPPGERSTLVGHDGDDEIGPAADFVPPPRGEPSSSARHTMVTFSPPTVLVGEGVSVGGMVRVGETQVLREERKGQVVRVAGIVAVGTVDIPRPAARSDDPSARQTDAVLLLAMHILGDAPSPEEVMRATQIDLDPAGQFGSGEAQKPPEEQAVALAWNGPLHGPTIRRAARLADRVIVLVREGAMGPADLASLQVRLGREDAIGFLVVGIDDDQVARRDRIGDVREFWTARRRLKD